jgi:hypothetical protein
MTLNIELYPQKLKFADLSIWGQLYTLERTLQSNKLG